MLALNRTPLRGVIRHIQRQVSLFHLAVLLIIALALVLPFKLALDLHQGVQGATADIPKPSAADLATLAIGATQYLVTLGIALIGLVGAALSERVLNLMHLSNPANRRMLYGGTTMAGLSLYTGFVAHEVILRAAADAIVRPQLELIIALHIAQLVELAVALLLIVFGIFRHLSHQQGVSDGH